MHTTPAGIYFSKLIFRKTYKKMYSCKFDIELKDNKRAEINVPGKTFKDCFEKVEAFLETKLTKDQYTII